MIDFACARCRRQDCGPEVAQLDLGGGPRALCQACVDEIRLALAIDPRPRRTSPLPASQRRVFLRWLAEQVTVTHEVAVAKLIELDYCDERNDAMDVLLLLHGDCYLIIHNDEIESVYKK